MRNFVRTAWLIGGVMAAALAVAACGDDDNGGTTEPDVTEIVVTVQTDGSAENGVSVALFESGGATSIDDGTTAGNGQVTFEVDPGTYEVEIEVPEGLELDDGETARKTVTVSDGESEAVAFDLVEPVDPNLAVVTLNAASFSPANRTIDVGGTVRWVNGAAVTHSITPDGHTEWSDVTVTSSGETFEHTFNSAGDFPYLCQFHAGMTGLITVN